MQTLEHICPVLVVEDNLDLCMIFKVILRKTCEFHIEHTLEGAEKFLSENKTAVIFLDNNLPDGTGILHIRQMLDKQPDIHVVIMTADTTEGLATKALEEGAMSFLRKPFSTTLIKDIVYTVCPNLGS